MPPVPQPGFPPPQGGRSGGHPIPPLPGGADRGDAGGTGPISDDALRRERDYQALLDKRNKLLTDTGPLRAVEMLRRETERLADAEQRYVTALQRRGAALGAAGGLAAAAAAGGIGGAGGVPGFGGGGGLGPSPATTAPFPARMYVPGLGVVPAPPGAQTGFALGKGSIPVLNAIGQIGGRAMDAVDAATAPFTDGSTRFFNTVNSLDPTGAVGALRRLQISMQRYGAGMTREQQLEKEYDSVMRPGTVNLPLERFRMDWDVSRMKAAAASDPVGALALSNRHWANPSEEAAIRGRLLEIDPLRTRYPVMAPGERQRDTVAGEQAYRERLAQLPGQRQESAELRELGAQKVALETMIQLRSRYNRMREEADKEAKRLEAQADKENAPKGSLIRAEVAAQSNYALGLQRDVIQMDDRIRQAREGVAHQGFRFNQANIELARTQEAQYAQREDVAASQSRRLIAMGPGGRLQGQASLRILQQMQEQGADLSMLPASIWQRAESVAPDTVRKMQERAGEGVVRRDREAGLLPKDEFRDFLTEIRAKRDAQGQLGDKATMDALKQLLRELVEAVTGVPNREPELFQELRQQIEEIKRRGRYQNNSGRAVPGS